MITKITYTEKYCGGHKKRIHTKYMLFGFITLYHIMVEQDAI